MTITSKLTPLSTCLRLLAVVAAVLSASCKQDSRSRLINEEGLIVKRQLFSDSVTIRRERTYLNDTLPHGYSKEFFENGQLKIYVEINKGKKHGRVVNYFRNGFVRVEGWNFEDNRDSVWVWYDSLGSILTKSRYDLGRQCGESLRYNKNDSNRYLSECYCFLPEEDGVFQYNAKYDSLENKTFEQGQGDPIIIFQSATYPKYKVDEMLIVRIYFCPCAVKSHAIVTLSDLRNGTELDRITIKSGQDYFRYSYRLKSKGEFQFKIEQAQVIIEDKVNVE